MKAHAEPVGGPLFTPAMRVLAVVVGIGAVLMLWRLVAGLGSTTALNDGYPLGLWIAFDVVTGTALACGGYAVAILVMILNKGRYHPLVRPAILTSALGYSLAGFSVFLDIGRWWYIWKVPLYFWHWNFDSALLEVALCIMTYIVVLWIELAPAFLEKWSDASNLLLRRMSRVSLRGLEKAASWIIALGLLLPTMHQSSLGTLMLLADSRLHPLWNTRLLPLMFLLTCVSMGFAVVVCESAFSSVAFKRRPDTSMLGNLAAAIVPVQLVVVAMRLADLAWRGQLGSLAAVDIRSLLVLIEFGLMLAPAVMLRSAARRRDLGHLVRAAMLMMFGGALYRFDTYLVAFTPGAHWSYFPSVPEILISTGLVAAEIMVYIAVVKTFPILAGRTAVTERQAA